MFSGVYTATSGMNADIHKMDVIANNLANADTPGFKREVIVQKSFSSLLEKSINGLPELTGTYLDKTQTDFTQGAAVFTGRKLDIYVSEGNFMSVQTDQGEGYTKNGSLIILPNGDLATSTGDRILGTGGPINIGEASDITISEDGYIYADNEAIDQLKIVQIDNTENFNRIRGSIFTPANKNNPPSISEEFIVKQNFLEASNVNGSGVIKEMVNMIKVQRHYETCQRMVLKQDEILNRSVNDLART